MVERNAFTDEQIQDYIDGRLRERDRAAVAAYLLAHPRVAAEVDAVRRQGEALRALGQGVLDEPVPENLRRILRAHPAPLHAERRSAIRRVTRLLPSFFAILAAIGLVCAGGVIGWFAHAFTRAFYSPT